MNALPLAWKTLRDLRGATLAIGATTFVMAVFIVAIFPSYAEQLAGIDFPALYDAFFGEAPISSPEGFTSAEFFSWVPLLIITLAIIGGTGAIAGEESAGTLDALLALPVRRRDVLLAKALGNGLALVIVTVVAYPGFAFTAIFVDFPIDWPNLWFATLAMLPISFLYLAIALWGSAALPNRGAAAILTIGLVVVPYVLNTMGAAVAELADLRKFSPFYWSEGSRVLVHGFQWGRTAGMLALAALVLLAALRAVERREIGSHGGWSLPWRRRATADHSAETPTPAPGGQQAG
jgi:ABC-2 type transport system permease protein